MRVLVTGGAGFIGSHIVDACVVSGHEVLVADDLSSGREGNIHPKARFERVDIRNAHRVEELIREFRPEFVNHHAAQVDVRRSADDPIYDAEANVLGTINLIRSAGQAGAKGFVFASSGGAMYGECLQPATETASKTPLSPYGVAKITAEMYLFVLSRLPGVRSVSLRYANVYGPRQSPGGEAGVVSIFANRMLDGKEPTIFGDGEQIRDYVYVEDIARVNLTMMEEVLLRLPEPASVNEAAINIASGESVSVNSLYASLAKLCAFANAPRYANARPEEVIESRMDTRKAGDVLGFKPAFSLEEGLLETVEWFRKQKDDHCCRLLR